MSVRGGGGQSGIAEITRLHQANINTEIVIGANPWLANDPVSLEKLALSGADPVELATNAGALAGMEHLDGLSKAMTQMSEVGQRAAYGKLTEQQQRGLAQMGYQPPEHKKGFLDDTLFESAWDLTTDVVSTAMRPVGFVAAPVAGLALDSLTWLGDVPGHFYRAIRQMEGWQQWLAAGAAVGAMVALPFAAPGLMAAMSGTLMTAGAFGAAGLAGATLATLPTAIHNPTEWWDIMNPLGRTGIRRGERIFLPEGQKKAREILGNAEHLDAMARDIAANVNMEDLAHEFAGVQNASNINVMVESIARVAESMADPSTPEYEQVYAGLAKLVEQEEFVQAVDALQSSKISFGRDVANAFQLDHLAGGRFYSPVSGAMDAMWLLTMDPTLAAGKIGKLNLLRRRGLEAPGSVDDAMVNLTRMVNEDKSVAATVNQVLDAVNSERYSQMPKAWRGVYQPMQEWKRSLNAYGELTEGFKVEDFMAYMEHGKGMQRVMEGKGTVRGLESIVISNVNNKRGWGRFQESIKDFQEGLTDETGFAYLRKQAKKYGVEADFDSQLPANALDEVVLGGTEMRALDAPLRESFGYRTGKAVGTGLVRSRVGRPFGDFISSISTMTPAGSAIKLTPASVTDMRDMGEDIPRFIETMGRHMGLNSRARKEWLDVTMRQGTVAQRRMVLNSFMDNMFEITGMKQVDEVAKLTDDFMRHYEQAYTLGGADVINHHHSGRAIRGIMPDAHQAVYMVMPDLREMHKIVRQGHVLKNMLRITDNNFTEQLMSRVIKPGWLLRIGFIPRAAGEEMLAFWMRMSEGGLLSEFGARRVAEVNEYRRANFALAEAGGDINKLSRYEQDALRNRLPSHLRPLERMGERIGWLDPDQHILTRWANWNHDLKQYGLSGVEGEFLADAPNWAKQLIRGKDHSVREMILNGVDPDYVEAAERWMRSNADNIMRATSANNASMFEKSVVNPDVQVQLVQDPNGGGDIEMLVSVKGERVRIAADDPRFANAIMHRAGEWMDDRVVRDIVADVFSRTVPKFDGIAQRQNLAEALEVLELGVDNYSMRVLVGELLSPRQDNWYAAASQIEDVMPEVADALRRTARRGGDDLNIHALRQELSNVKNEMRAGAPGFVDIDRIYMIQNMENKLDDLAPIIDGLDALTPTERAFFTSVMSRQMLSEHKAYDLDAVRKWATSSGDTPVPPKLTYYRGVPDDKTLRINPDGSLTLIPQSQTHWEGRGAISMSTDREHSLLSYANRRGGSSGALLELDGDYINSINNTTIDALRANPTSYRHTRYEGDGLYMVGKDDLSNHPFHEVAWATETEVTIPAGKWKIADRDEYEMLLANGTGINVDEFKIKGKHFDEVNQPTITAIDRFMAGLTEQERTILATSMTENMEEIKRFNTDRWLNPDLQAPEPVVGSNILDAAWQPTGDAEIDRLQDKLRKLMDTKVGGDVTVRDVLLNAAEAAPGDARPYALDDVFREKLGMSGESLFRRNDQMNQVHALDKQGDRSQINSLLEDGWGLRGHGGWENLSQTDQWSPFYDDFQSAREALVNNIAAALARPQNQQWVKQSDWLASTVDGTPVVRPPADGLTSIYTPVVPPRSTRIDKILDEVDTIPSEFPGDRAIGGDLRYALENRPDLTPAELRNIFGPARVHPDTGETVLRIQDPEMREAFLEADEWLAEMDQAAPILAEDRDLMMNLLDEFTQRDTSLDAAVQRLMERPVQWEYHDEVIDSLSEEEKFNILKRALGDYRAGRVEYAQGTSQPLHHLAFDDPRVAKWISSMMADNADQAQRVGRLDVGRVNLTDSGAGKEGVRLVNAADQAGRAWQLDNRYLARAVPMDAPAFHHVPTEVQRYKLNSGVEVERTFDVVIGKSQEQALHEWAERITDHILTSNRRGVREAQVARPNVENKVARRVNDRYESLTPGERISTREDYFLIDEEGKVKDSVDWGSNEYFDHELDAFEDELMWNITGPMLRDHYEQVAGMGRKVPKNFRPQRGVLEGSVRKVRVDEPMAADSLLNMKRSRLEDVGLEPSASLPNVGTAQRFDIHTSNAWDKMVQFGFNKVIGPMLDSMARKPMSFHYYAAAFKQHKNNLRWLLNEDLFEVQFAEEFSTALRILQEEATIADDQLDAARLIAREAYGIDLSQAPAHEVQAWISTIGHDQQEYVAVLKGLQKEFRSRAMGQAAEARPDLEGDFLADWVGEASLDYPANRVSEAALSLQSLNRNSLKITIPRNTIGGRTPSEQLVAAYHAAIPSETWELGRDAVTAYLRNVSTGLPSNLSPSQWRVLKQARNNMAHIFDTADEVASMRAIENVAPFLDSHEQRSMFAAYGKNMLPFWYAEENFIKRWARTLSLGQFGLPGIKRTLPSGGLDQLRKAQLTYMGIKNAGMIRTDNNGQDWVVYPGSQILTKAVSKIPGMGDLLPAGVQFQARTDSLLPGVTPEGNVGVNPFFGVTASAVLHFFPDGNDMKTALLGDLGATKSVIEQFVPTTLSNAWRAAFGNEDSAQRYASAMMQAIAFMEAEGKGLPDNADAAQLDEYLDKVRNHARIIMTAQMLAGFVVPGAPSAIATGQEHDYLGLGIEDPRAITSDMYREFIENMGIEEGTVQFLATYPQADLEDVVNPYAFTQSGTQSVSGAPLPATKYGLSWYDSNREWVDALPEAGAWFMPPDESDEGFHYEAFAQQVASGLRKRRSPQEYITAIKYRQGAETYFTLKNQVDEKLASLGPNVEAKREVQQRWDMWKAEYLAAHPIFAEQLQSGDARVRRDRTVKQLRQAVYDPAAPDSPNTEGIKEMVDMYDQYRAYYEQFSAKTDADSRAKVRQLKDNFDNWAVTWTMKYPELERLYTSVYRVEANI